uniref:Pherophorin-C2 protein n=1 Tax=Chlamydomonas reinhardtii TaxID=3055 RepID=Q3HTK5_CHLRE|nr:pherophorin-C2 protein precursor [Chlamydomonas reinhardtii]
MRCSILVSVLFAAAIAAAQGAQSGLYTSFPYCQCKKSPSAYKLGDVVVAKGNNQYCFKLSAKVPAGCTDYCCSKADLKKIEFNVYEACDVFGEVVKATINGVPTKVGVSFHKPTDGPVGSTTLVLTQLGLGLASDGAEICITLSMNKNGKGCTTLEELCIPPPGLPKGVCSAALFDSQNDCCPISTPGIPSPPPPSPPPPSPPPPSPPPPSPPPPSPPPPSPPPPSPPPPSPPPPSPPPPPPPSPPPPSPPPPSPPPPPPPSPPPPSPPPPSPPPPPPPSPPPPPPPSPPPPPPPSPPPPSPPPPSPPPPPPPSPPPPSPPPPSPPPPSPPPPPPPSPPPPPPPSPPPPPPPSPPPPSPPPPSPPPPSPPPPSPPPPPPPSPPPPPPPSPPPPPPPSPPPPSPPPPSPPPPSPPPPSPPPPSPPPPSPPPPPPPSPPPPPPPSPPPPPPPSPPPPPPPSPPPPPPPSPPPPSPPPPSPPPPSPPPPSPPPPPPPSPPPPPPPSPPPPPPPSPPPPSPPPPSPPPPSPPPPSPPPPSPPPPPPPSPPPPSPPPPSPPPPCQVCVYISLTVSDASRVLFPYSISNDECQGYIATIQDDVATQASDLGVTVTPGSTSCAGNLVMVCATFFSNEEGAKLQSFVDTQINFWLDMVTQGCRPALAGYTVVVSVGGMGDAVAGLPQSCINAQASAACALQTPDFPKCQCVTTPGATPFAIAPAMSSMAGRTKDTTAYCFSITLVTPNSATSPCGRSTSLLKAEFYADDKKRRAITGVYVQPKTGTGKWLSATWGAVDEQTVKATPLNWSKDQANGGKICLELKNDTPLSDFCLPANDGVCWGNVFDDTKNCCPLFAAAQP